MAAIQKLCLSAAPVIRLRVQTMADQTEVFRDLTKRERLYIEFLARRCSPKTVAESAYNAPMEVKRGRPPFWPTPEVGELIELAQHLSRNEYFAEIQTDTDALLELGAMHRDPDGGLPSIAVKIFPNLRKIAKLVGSQNKESIARQIRGNKNRT